MAEQEVDVITHLIDVEKRAATLTAEAQEEADKRISAARAKADESYRTQYAAIVAKEEAAYTEQTAELTKKYEQTVSSYKTRIAASAKSDAAFAALLDKLLA